MEGSLAPVHYNIEYNYELVLVSNFLDFNIQYGGGASQKSFPLWFITWYL